MFVHGRYVACIKFSLSYKRSSIHLNFLCEFLDSPTTILQKIADLLCSCQLLPHWCFIFYKKELNGNCSNIWILTENENKHAQDVEILNVLINLRHILVLPTIKQNTKAEKNMYVCGYPTVPAKKYHPKLFSRESKKNYRGLIFVYWEVRDLDLLCHLIWPKWLND